MPFRFEFWIDTEKLNGVEIGFSTSRKWEEALDEARLVVPFSYLNKTPYKMFALLTIKIHQFETYVQVNPTATQNHYYLVYSDSVSAVGAYGYYEHTVDAIEYTGKLDAYIVSRLATSRSLIDENPARFETNPIIIVDDGGKNQFRTGAYLTPLDVKTTYVGGKVITFPLTDPAFLRTYGTPDGFQRGDAVIKTNAPLISGNASHNLTVSAANWVFPKGSWYIEYGFNAPNSQEHYTIGYNFLYRFYINVIDEYGLTIYDALDEIRTCVSKFGGLEDTVYFDSTRVFDIDPIYETYLKSIPAPQMYLERTTARKMLIYILAFINSLPRLVYGDDLDTLTIESYNLSTGTFSKADVIAHSAVQNTSQIGTRNYQHISQSLANDLDEPSVYSPSAGGWQQVRSLDIQLTDSNFILQLPKEYPIYTPKHLYVEIPNVTLIMDVNSTSFERVNIDNYKLDLMPRFINKEYWKLKDVTANFPSIDTTATYDQDLGMRKNMISNLTWGLGDTEINLSTIFGTVFASNLVRNVVTEMVYEHYVRNMGYPITGLGDYASDYRIEITLPSNSEYKDWRFRLEYITDERLVIKQDKEDLSQISFYSEMLQNQEESLVNVLRQSRKGYGDLQRTGNVAFTFAKRHLTFDDFYEVGQTDSDGYTITQIDTVWYNNEAIAKYYLTRYHNRIQQATYVNQKYRPFDNFAKTVLNRHENYTDYLIALPPNDTTVLLQDQTTKIYSNENTIQEIVEIALGGIYSANSSTKATVALVRTDGMLEVYDESLELNTRYYISVPVTAKGIKGGFAFTFGFQSNQVAGDGLVSKTVGSGILAVTTWYNQAVRYTDEQGRFTRLGFVILRSIEFDGTDYEKYPLWFETTANTDTLFQSKAYFWCGNALQEEPFQRPLIWNKDPLTNANLTYQLSMISYYMGLYVFGIDFYAKNFIVNNPNGDMTTYLYLYTNGTTYEMFDDIYVKSGYSSSVLLDKNALGIGTANIEFDATTNWLKFIGISMVGITSWAIGMPDEDGSIRLLIACNENLNGVQFKAQHIRPNVYEIGAKLPLIYWFDFSTELQVQVDLTYVVGPSYQETLDVSLLPQADLTHVAHYGYPIDMSIDLTVRTRLTFFEGTSEPIILDIDQAVVVDLVMTPTYFQEFGIDIGLTSNVALGYTWDMGYAIDVPLTILSTLEHQFNASYEVDVPLTNAVDLVYSWNMDLTLDIPLNIGLNWQYTPTYYQELIMDIDLTTVANLTHEWGMNYDFDTPLTIGIGLEYIYGLSYEIDTSLISTVDLIHTWDMGTTIDTSLNISINYVHVATYNREFGVDIDLTVNVGLVYEKYEPKVATPTIDVLSHTVGSDAGGTFYNIIFRITNNDEATATLKRTDLIVATSASPYIVVGSYASGASSDYIELQDYYTSPPTLFVNAIATGQLNSDIVTWNAW